MSNRGIAPYQIGTDIGTVRVSVGDTEYVPLDPPEAGFGNYNVFSDDEITQFLVAGGSSINRAIGNAYMRLAVIAAVQAVDWKSDDLAITLSKRADTLRGIAKDYFALADDEVDLAAADGFVIIYPAPLYGHIEAATDPSPFYSQTATYRHYPFPIPPEALF